MQAMVLILLACLVAGCLSAAREREAHCLAATMTDVWRTDDDLTLAEQDWRTAQYARGERSMSLPTSSRSSTRVADAPATVGPPAARFQTFAFPSPQKEEDATLYRRLVAARARHGEASKWHALVARRVQTRIEEDEMLYPVLSMLATSTAIVIYPLVRWNVRSVLWDGADPDAEDDPVQRFCAARLEGG